MKNISGRFFRLLVLSVISAVLLSGCGFKLRGSIELPAEMEKLYVTGNNRGVLQNDLKLLYENAGAEIVAKSDDALSILVLNKVLFTRRTLSVGSDGKVLEYELHYRVNFELKTPDGEVIVKSQDIDLTRSVLNPEIEVLGRAQEQRGLQNTMEGEIARLIAIRLYAQTRPGGL